MDSAGFSVHRRGDWDRPLWLFGHHRLRSGKGVLFNLAWRPLPCLLESTGEKKFNSGKTASKTNLENPMTSVCYQLCISKSVTKQTGKQIPALKIQDSTFFPCVNNLLQHLRLQSLPRTSDGLTHDITKGSFPEMKPRAHMAGRAEERKYL